MNLLVEAQQMSTYDFQHMCLYRWLAFDATTSRDKRSRQGSWIAQQSLCETSSLRQRRLPRHCTSQQLSLPTACSTLHDERDSLFSS